MLMMYSSTAVYVGVYRGDQGSAGKCDINFAPRCECVCVLSIVHALMRLQQYSCIHINPNRLLHLHADPTSDSDGFFCAWLVVLAPIEDTHRAGGTNFTLLPYASPRVLSAVVFAFHHVSM